MLFMYSQTNAVLPASETGNPAVATGNFGAFNIFSGQASSAISLDSAIEAAMTNNIALSIEKLRPVLSATAIEKARSRFDTTVNAELSASEKLSQSMVQAKTLGKNASNKTDLSVTMEKTSSSGTTTQIGLSLNRSRNERTNDLYSSRIGVNIQHPLLQGSGKEVNLVSLRKSELDQQISDHELQAFVINLAAQVESRYWQYHLSLRQLEIVRESLALAAQQREETFKRIEAGSIPESEAAAAEAEVAMRQEDLINAESSAVTSAVALLRSINPDSENFWQYQPSLDDQPALHQPNPESLETHIQTALDLRPEIAQARLLLKKDLLDVVYSRNGVLPKLDFFVTLGKTGYSDSMGGVGPKPGEAGSYDISAGFIYELTQGRRSARAELQKARVSAAMKEESIKNLQQLVKEDVINAFIEVQRTLQQITATSATSQKQLEKLRVEEVRFSVGKTTSFQVAQAQRDLTAARIAEIKAAIDHTLALTDLYRADGSLLQRHNIVTATSN